LALKGTAAVRDPWGFSPCGQSSVVGDGILKGLAETARNFFGSYVSKDRLITLQYPEQRVPQIEARAAFPSSSTMARTGSRGCAASPARSAKKSARPSASSSKKSKDKKPDAVGKPQFYPAVFNIDISVCMSCQICVEVCPFDAIKMDVDYDLSTDDRFGGLLLDKQRLPNPTNITTRSTPPKRQPWMRARRGTARQAAKAKAAAEAKSDAEAKLAEATPAQPAIGEPQ
jgi:NADH-quinone oxidoreductase subunit I